MLAQTNFVDPYPFAIFHADGTPFEHNLYGSEVVEFFDNTDGRRYKSVPQKREHRAEEAPGCEECRVEFTELWKSERLQ